MRVFILAISAFEVIHLLREEAKALTANGNFIRGARGAS